MPKWKENRGFSKNVIYNKWEQQDHKCARCDEKIPIKKAQGHHPIAWSRGGPTRPENLEVVDDRCHKILTYEERGDGFGRKEDFGYSDSKRGENLVKKFYKR